MLMWSFFWQSGLSLFKSQMVWIVFRRKHPHSFYFSYSSVKKGSAYLEPFKWALKLLQTNRHRAHGMTAAVSRCDWSIPFLASAEPRLTVTPSKTATSEWEFTDSPFSKSTGKKHKQKDLTELTDLQKIYLLVIHCVC